MSYMLKLIVKRLNRIKQSIYENNPPPHPHPRDLASSPFLSFHSHYITSKLLCIFYSIVVIFILFHFYFISIFYMVLHLQKLNMGEDYL